MYGALTIANWFILKNNSQREMYECEEFGAYEGLTHLKLQKLLYYAQGIHLAFTGKPLFREKIWAWRHGPVVEEVYQAFKSYGSDIIDTPYGDQDEITRSISDLDGEANETLELTYNNFAIYTAWQLRNMTHEDGTPWDTVIKTRGEKVIPTETIREYFLDKIIEK